MTDRIDAFEGARGVLALWVVVYHVLAISGISVPGLLLGDHAVSVFFALSGFVIAFLLSRQEQSYRSFITNRFFRLYPVYALCVAIGAGLIAMGLMPKRVEPGTELIHGLLHGTMLHGLVPDGFLRGSSSAFLNPAWSISVEWQFYLVIPFFFYLLKKYRTAAWILLFASALAHRLLAEVNAPVGGAMLVAHSKLFVVGITSFFLYTWALQHRASVSRAAGLLSIGVPMLALSFLPLGPNVGLLIWLCLFGCVLSVRLGCAPYPMRMLNDVLIAPRILWLGTISYPLYLVHEPVVWLCLHLVRRLLPFADLPVMATAIGLAALPASLSLASVCHKYIEVPGIAWGKQLAGRKSRVATRPVDTRADAGIPREP